MLGQVLAERYQLQEYLSTNPGRKTFLAKDLQTQELVVVKLLPFGLDFSWQDLKLFEREAETLQSLSHSNIPRFLDSFEVDLPHLKCFAIAQTYIPGTSLDNCLKDGRVFTEIELKEIARKLLEILIYLHGHCPPVVHRDIKPGNIIINNRSGNCLGDVYLVDFGSVQTVAARDGRSFTVTGTYGYMPPEQFGGRAVPASDLYALGGTLIYLATGIHPGELPQKDLKLEFEPLAENLSADFVAWLNSAIEPSLERRLSSAKEALQKLDAPPIYSSIEPRKINPLKRQLITQIILKKDKKSLEVTIPKETYPSSSCSVLFVIFSILFSGLLFSVSPSILYAATFLCLATNTISLKTRDIFTIKGDTISWRTLKQWSLNNYFQKILKFVLRQPAEERFRKEAKVKLVDKRANISRLYLVNWTGGNVNGVVYHQLIQICTKEKIFSLPPMSVEEGSWLINELSAWLKMPIEVRLSSVRGTQSQTTKR